MSLVPSWLCDFPQGTTVARRCFVGFAGFVAFVVGRHVAAKAQAVRVLDWAVEYTYRLRLGGDVPSNYECNETSETNKTPTGNRRALGRIA